MYLPIRNWVWEADSGVVATHRRWAPKTYVVAILPDAAAAAIEQTVAADPGLVQVQKAAGPASI